MRDEPIDNGAETIMSRKKVSEIERGAGFFHGFLGNLMDVVREQGRPFEVVYRLATPAGRATLGRMVNVAYDDWQAEQPKPSSQIIDAGGSPYRGEVNGKNIIVVPDLAAVDLTAITKGELNLTYLDSDYERWDYYRGNDGKPISGRGKRFKWDLWRPGRKASSNEVRKYFEAKGFYGHVGAFTQWRRVCGLKGYHASIPDDNGCWRDSGGRLCAPYSYFDDDDRRLRRHWVDDPCRECWSFVAFHELSA